MRPEAFLGHEGRSKGHWVPQVPQRELLAFISHYFLARVYKQKKPIRVCFAPTSWHCNKCTIEQQELKHWGEETAAKCTPSVLSFTAFWAQVREKRPPHPNQHWESHSSSTDWNLRDRQKSHLGKAPGWSLMGEIATSITQSIYKSINHIFSGKSLETAWQMKPILTTTQIQRVQPTPGSWEELNRNWGPISVAINRFEAL